MPKASEVARELRRVADALWQAGDVEIVKPQLQFYTWDREPFLATARVLPRPLEKTVMWPESPEAARLVVGHKSEALEFDVSAPRSKVCTIIEPAKPAVYDCATILTAEEEEALTK